jgi:hypothetical protein
MNIKTNIKAGKLTDNHSETMTGDSKRTVGLKVKTNIKAGGTQINHNEKVTCFKKRSKSLTVRTGVKAGGIGTSPTVTNHNEKLLRNKK